VQNKADSVKLQRAGVDTSGHSNSGQLHRNACHHREILEQQAMCSPRDKITRNCVLIMCAWLGIITRNCVLIMCARAALRHWRHVIIYTAIHTSSPCQWGAEACSCSKVMLQRLVQLTAWRPSHLTAWRPLHLIAWREAMRRSV
jgi:hypothetical protein